MHIAICDDNVGDRKQLERLLKRESDKRIHSSGVLYIDSYGNPSKLLSAPLHYDAYYIDICFTEGIAVSEIISSLIATGVSSPIILCCSNINYREQSFPENVIFLDKPIKVSELSDSLDYSLKIKNSAEVLLELRTQKETLYVTEDKILYAIEHDRHCDIHLTDGQIIEVVTTVSNLFSDWEAHESFFCPSNKVLLNGRHIIALGFFKVTMLDKTSFPVDIKCMKYAKYIYHALH